MASQQNKIRRTFLQLPSKDRLHANIGWLSLSGMMLVVGLWVVTERSLALTWREVIAGAMVGSGITYWYFAASLQKQRRKTKIASNAEMSEGHFFDQYLTQRILERQSMALLLCNIDFFQQFNETYGRAAGESCLEQVYESLQHSVRKGDLVTPMGTATFVVVLPNTAEHTAIQIAERVRSQVEQLNIAHGNSPISQVITISGGLAFCHAEETFTSAEFLDAATQLLSLSQHRGRNQITNRLQGIFADIPENPSN